jgi:mono/diheme cytochrome c family protein
MMAAYLPPLATVAATKNSFTPTADMLKYLLPAFLLPFVSIALADEAAPPVETSYWRDVRPIFQAHCQGCHQPAKKGGEYVMTTFEQMLAGGETGEAAIVPGDPDASHLVRQITPTDGVAEMPKGKSPLGEKEIELIRKWIAAGAADDTPASARQKYDQDHPPRYAALPVITAVASSPDGKLLAVSGYHEVLMHDWQKLLAGEPSLVARLVGMSERIESVAFSPDGASLAVAGGSPGRLGEVQIWSVPDAALKLSIPASYDTCYGASWSPDGKLVAFGCPDNTARAIEAATGKQIFFNGAHNDWVLDTAFSVNSTNLVTVSRDRSMKLMEVATERFIDNITSITPGALKGGLHSVDRHPTRDELLIGGADGVPKLYRMFREKARVIGDDFNLIRQFPALPGRIFEVHFRKDGEQVVAASSLDGAGHVHVYNTENAQQIATLQDISSAIYAVAFHSEGKHVVSGGFDGYLLIHDAQSGTLVSRVVPVPLEVEHSKQ